MCRLWGQEQWGFCAQQQPGFESGFSGFTGLTITPLV